MKPQNELVERKIMDVIDKSRTPIVEANLIQKFGDL